MRLTFYLDKGALWGWIGRASTMDGKDRSYAEVQALSYRVARALDRSGIALGAKVAICPATIPLPFPACSASRAPAVSGPINPRNEAN